MNLMNYFSIFRKVYGEIKVQKQFNKDFLLPYLKELETTFGGSFMPEQKNKIVNYYGLFITSFLCSSYKRLYGKLLTSDERRRTTLFGILTPVGDDLFDIDRLDIESIKAITFTPDNYTAVSFSSKVAKAIQSYLLRHVPHSKEYLVASKNVLEIQIETAKQTDCTISREELERITFTKGAVSVVIYHQALDDAATEQMQEVLFQVGSLYQLGNDIFDLYKDVRDNIYTLINTCDDYKVFKENFINKVKLQNSKIMALPYANKNKKEFCILINSINARSLVAIDRLIKLQKKKGTKINWWLENRKLMICDMEKLVNKIRWFLYIYKLPKLKLSNR